MQKFTLLICSLCALVVLGIGLNSCKDEEPFVKPNLKVSDKSLTVAEGAGTVQLEFTLDRGAPGDITIEYSLSGTAISPADYTVVGTEGEVQIANGATSGTVEIQIVSDAIYEGNETIEISIEDVDSDNVIVTNDDETEITITDDDPQISASFATTTLTVKESDNAELLELQVSLSSPALQAVTIQYQLAHPDAGGFAVDDIYATAEDIPGQFIDFEIEGGAQQVVIAQGATSGVIQFQLLSDFRLEDPEKIEVTLTEATNGVQIGTNNKMTVTLEQENGKAIVLVWQDTTAPIDVDMDMFLWIGEVPAELALIAGSTNPNVNPQYEILFVPDLIEDAAFGMSYTYYEGTQTPLNLESHFIDFVDGELAQTFDSYSASYTLANINKWDADGAPDPTVVQTFKKVAGEFVDVSTITVPTTGSRMPTIALPSGLKKVKENTPAIFKKIAPF
jgi:Calx-beta domain